MKTSQIFLCFFTSVLLLSTLNFLTLKKTNLFSQESESITKSQAFKSYLAEKIGESLTLKTSNKDSTPNRNLPTYTNRGFKCVPIVTKAVTSRLASEASSASNSEGTQVANTITTYVATRISSNSFQCLSSDSKACNIYKTTDACTGDFSSVNSPAKIISIEDKHKKVATDFYFNRWICPNESGLSVAVKYVYANNSYRISCLANKTGDDCYYDENAAIVCERVNTCSDAEKDFGSLICGSTEFTSRWFNNGLDFPLRSWCKSAQAWLRFDTGITIAKDTANDKIKKGYLTDPEGMTACVASPENSKECLVENDNGILTKTAGLYNTDTSKFSALVVCNERNFSEAVIDSKHMCAKIFDSHDKGVFSLSLTGK